MDRFFFTFLLLTLSGGLLYGQKSLIYESGGELLPGQAAYTVHHYDLALRIDPADSSLSGRVYVLGRLTEPSREILLALDPRFTVESIRDLTLPDDHHLEITQKEGSRHLLIDFLQTRHAGQEIHLEILYHGKPKVAKNPPWDGGFVWARTPSGDPWLGVTAQTVGAWSWWPNKDHPSDRPDSVSITLTLPGDLLVASNGRLRGVSVTEEGWKSWHWFSASPISNYNVTFNAAPYRTITGRYESVTGRDVEMIFWVLPEYFEQGERLFPQFADQLRFFEELLGPYPFRHEKYGVAHAPYLGMEHQTLIAYGAGFENDRLFATGSGFDDLHHHELAHEWWGNMVSVSDWSDFWIHEGFATYMQALYAGHLQGEQAYNRMMQVFRRRIVSSEVTAPRHPVTSREIYQSSRGADVYFKGAWFLHTLRYYLGDEIFFESLRRFAYPDPELERVTDGRQLRHVTTDDYLDLLNRLSGEELGWLFEVYLRSEGLPVLKKERDGERLTLLWEVPGDLEFPMPVEVQVNGRLDRFQPHRNRICITLPEAAEYKIDPGHRILMEHPGSAL